MPLMGTICETGKTTKLGAAGEEYEIVPSIVVEKGGLPRGDLWCARMLSRCGARFDEVAGRFLLSEFHE